MTCHCMGPCNAKDCMCRCICQCTKSIDYINQQKVYKNYEEATKESQEDSKICPCQQGDQNQRKT